MQNSEFIKKRMRTFELNEPDESTRGLNLVAGGHSQAHHKTSLDESRAIQRLRLAYQGVSHGGMSDDEFVQVVEEIQAQVESTLAPLQDPQFQKMIAQRPANYQDWVHQSREALFDLQQALALMLNWLDSGLPEELDDGFAQAMEAYALIDAIQDQCEANVTAEDLEKVQEMERAQDLEDAQADLC